MTNSTSVAANPSANTKVVLITGVSSGIGKATAELFAQRGWQVVGTMRDVAQHAKLFTAPNIELKNLDVTQESSIHELMNWIEQQYGHLDVVVNNAGFGLFGAFETCSEQDIKQQFEVNVFGLMRVTREAIRLMRSQKKGTIIQISSMGGRFTFPFYSLYHSTKFAVEGFTESLMYELQPFGIQVKLVEPGAIRSDFYSRSRKEGTHTAFTSLYRQMSEHVWDQYQKAGATGSSPEVVAKVIWKAAHSCSNKLRFPAGWDAKANLLAVKFGSFRVLSGYIRRRIMEGSQRAI